MLFLPMLIVVGALAALAGGSRPHPQDAVPVAPVVTGRRRRSPPAGAAPSATAILVEFIRLGRRPPPALISSALAEAQRAGQDELAMAIVDTYIRPVVDAAERGGYHENWRASQPALFDANSAPYGYARIDEPQPAQDPYVYQPYAEPSYGAPYAAPPPGQMPGPMPGPMPGQMPDPTPSLTQPMAPNPAPSAPMLHYPGAGAPPISAPPGAFGPPASGPPVSTWGPPNAAPTSMLPLGANATDDDILRMIERMSTPAPQAGHLAQVPAAPMPGSFDPGAPLEGPPSSTGPGTITVSGRSSPIDGVGTTEWSRFCDRMSRELPTYTSTHHVGQFRQRRGRLLELGIDPETVLTSPEHQRTAFDVDMSEAYRRAHASGLLACVGHPVEVPVQDGPSQVAQVTTSGVLAVVQAAGVEGALGWFRTPQDRRRFAGTTAVFSRANGVF